MYLTTLSSNITFQGFVFLCKNMYKKKLELMYNTLRKHARFHERLQSYATLVHSML